MIIAISVHYDLSASVTVAALQGILSVYCGILSVYHQQAMIINYYRDYDLSAGVTAAALEAALQGI